MEDHRDHLFELSCRCDFAPLDRLIARLAARRRKRLTNGVGRVAADLEGRGLLSIAAITTLLAQLEIQIVEASDNRFSVALRRALLAGVAVFAWLFGPVYQRSASAGGDASVVEPFLVFSANVAALTPWHQSVPGLSTAVTTPYVCFVAVFKLSR